MRAILTYHSIDASGSPISIDPLAFARHVELLASGRVRVLPLAELVSRDTGEDAVALTFDDGCQNFAEEAWPRLAEHGLPATLFVVTRRVGTDNAWGGRDEPKIPRLPLLGWDALGKLAAEGLELGAHGRTHARLEKCAEAQLTDEIEGSAADLAERTGRRPAAFCYPYGDFDDRAVARVKASFARACTTELRLLAPDDDVWRLPRLDAYYLSAPGRLEGFGTPAFARYLKARGALRRLRGLLPG